jgi:hypothetical protein
MYSTAPTTPRQRLDEPGAIGALTALTRQGTGPVTHQPEIFRRRTPP